MKKILSLLLLSIVTLSGCSWQKSAETSPVITTPIDQEYFKVETPIANSKITNPLTISGQAKGTMFFEGSFPVSVEDSNGKNLGTGIAEAEGEWMTEKMVTFKSTINFKTSSTKNGFIILKNDNPSGLPGNEHSVKFPISFK